MAQLTIPHPGQKLILNAWTRYRVVACGRRFGKTAAGKILVTELALRGAQCWWLAPTYAMTAQVWKDLKRDLNAQSLGGEPRGAIRISESQRTITLPTGGSIAIRSTHTPDHLRGVGLDFAILDEAAYMQPDVWSEVVRPMLLERKGGAAFLSTPRGLNWFWELFKLGLDPEEPDWASFQFASDANPLIDPRELDTIRRGTPERVFSEEYLAQFVSDTGRVFRGVREVATAPLHAKPIAGRRYVAGIDWGREDDYTCIVIIDADSAAVVAIDRFRQARWEQQRSRLATLCTVWQPAVVWAEANSIGSVNIEALQAEGLPVRPFNTTHRSKAPLIEGLALAIERREIQLIPDEVMLNELVSYSLERLTTGGYRYNAPAGSHDDTVIALALAWHGVRYGGAGVSFA